MTEVNTLSTQDLAAAIGPVSYAGKPVPVHGTIPDRVSAPAIVVDYGEPWIDNAEGYPHGVYVVNLAVRVLAGTGLTSASYARVVKLVETVIARLQDDDTWQVGTVGGPFPLSPREGVTYLAVDVPVTALAQITED